MAREKPAMTNRGRKSNSTVKEYMKNIYIVFESK